MPEINLDQTPTSAVFGRVVYPPAGEHGPRRSRGIQVFCIERGEARISVDGESRYVGPQQASLFLPGSRDFFRFARTEESEHTWCMIYADELSDRTWRTLRALPSVVPTSQALDELIATGLSLRRSGLKNTSAPLVRLAQAVLEAYADAQQPSATPWPVPVEKAAHWMRRHSAEPIAMRQVAQAAGVTVNHLTRLFARHVGHTPARYLWRLREEQAMALLRDTGLNVSEIADRTGFASPFHLSRRIRNRYSLSPRALRQRLWNEPDRDR